MNVRLVEQDERCVNVAEKVSADAVVATAPGKALAKAETRLPLDGVDLGEDAKWSPSSGLCNHPAAGERKERVGDNVKRQKHQKPEPKLAESALLLRLLRTFVHRMRAEAPNWK